MIKPNPSRPSCYLEESSEPTLEKLTIWAVWFPAREIDSFAVQTLNRVSKRGPVRLQKQVRPHVNPVVRTDSHKEPIEHGVMQAA